MVMIIYLLIVIPVTRSAASATPYEGVEIVVDDRDSVGFVSAADIIDELDSLPRKVSSIPRSDINTDEIASLLNGLDKIEHSSCVKLNNDWLRIYVKPMCPVARIFDHGGNSYYVSSTGKRISSDLRYHVDVPVVSADFDSLAQAKSLLPVLDFIKNNPSADALVSSIKVNRRGDIILIPIIRGHVVNFGDESDIANKWERLMVMYREVMPVRGWDYYDTISVKWKGQVVASRRVKARPEPSLQVLMSIDTVTTEADLIDILPTEEDMKINQSQKL